MSTQFVQQFNSKLCKAGLSYGSVHKLMKELKLQATKIDEFQFSDSELKDILSQIYGTMKRYRSLVRMWECYKKAVDFKASYFQTHLAELVNSDCNRGVLIPSPILHTCFLDPDILKRICNPYLIYHYIFSGNAMTLKNLDHVNMSEDTLANFKRLLKKKWSKISKYTDEVKARDIFFTMLKHANIENASFKAKNYNLNNVSVNINAIYFHYFKMKVIPQQLAPERIVKKFLNGEIKKEIAFDNFEHQITIENFIPFYVHFKAINGKISKNLVTVEDSYPQKTNSSLNALPQYAKENDMLQWSNLVSFNENGKYFITVNRNELHKFLSEVSIQMKTGGKDVIYLDIKTYICGRETRIAYFNIQIQNVLYSINLNGRENREKEKALYGLIFGLPNMTIIGYDMEAIINILKANCPTCKELANVRARIICLKTKLNEVSYVDLARYFPKTWKTVFGGKMQLDKGKLMDTLTFAEVCYLTTGLIFDDSEDHESAIWNKISLRTSQIEAQKSKIVALVLSFREVKRIKP